MAVNLPSAVPSNSLNTLQRLASAPPETASIDAALGLLQQLVSGDAFSTRTPQGIREGGCYGGPALPDPRTRCFPSSEQNPNGALLQRLTQFLQALTQLLSMMGSLGELGGSQPGGPGTSPGGTTGPGTSPGGTTGPGTSPGGTTGPGDTAPAWEADFLKNASPRERANYAVLKANHLPITQQEASAMSGMGPEQVAKFMLGKFASTPEDIVPPDAVARQWPYVSPQDRANYQLQKAATKQSHAFRELMDSLDHGGPSPELEAKDLKLLDDRQRAEYQLAKAARQSGQGTAANAPAIEQAKARTAAENGAFNRVLDMMSRGGPRNAAEWSRYSQDLQSLSPANRDLAFRVANASPQEQMSARMAVQRQTQAYGQLLDLLEHAPQGGAPNSMLGAAMAQSWQYLNDSQRAEFMQLKAGATGASGSTGSTGTDGASQPPLDYRARIANLSRQQTLSGDLFSDRARALAAALAQLTLRGIPAPGSDAEAAFNENLRYVSPEQRTEIQSIVDQMKSEAAQRSGRGRGRAGEAFRSVSALNDVLRRHQELSVRRPFVA